VHLDDHHLSNLPWNCASSTLRRPIHFDALFLTLYTSRSPREIILCGDTRPRRVSTGMRMEKQVSTLSLVISATDSTSTFWMARTGSIGFWRAFSLHPPPHSALQLVLRVGAHAQYHLQRLRPMAYISTKALSGVLNKAWSSKKPEIGAHASYAG
jgi:hypothetical protein